MAARIQIRPLTRIDERGATEFAESVVADSPYAEPALDALRAALASDGDEYLGLVAASGDDVIGLVLYGLVAGTAGTGRLSLIAVARDARRRGIARRLVATACDAIRARGGRFAVAEVPDDPALEAVHAFLRAAEFGEETRIADYFREGVALIIYRLTFT